MELCQTPGYLNEHKEGKDEEGQKGGKILILTKGQ